MPDPRDALLTQLIVDPVGVTDEQAVSLVREHYGLAVRVARLTGERDENFKLTTAAGAEYVLKVASARESPAATELQTAALLHLERVDPRIPCPRVLRTGDGEAGVRLRDANGAQRSAHVLSISRADSCVMRIRRVPSVRRAVVSLVSSRVHSVASAIPVRGAQSSGMCVTCASWRE